MSSVFRIFLLILSIFPNLAIAQGERGLNTSNASVNEEATGTTYAMIVGISDYPNITPLKYADKDAQLFREYLLSKAGGAVKSENIQTLLNNNAKGGDLIRSLLSLEQLPYKKGDKLYIYMAGHGDAINESAYYFLGHDISIGSGAGDKNNYRMGFALSMYDVKITMSNIVKKGVTVILVMDACRSSENPNETAGQKLFSNGIIESQVGEILLLSASPGESAIESPEIGSGHGLFTWYLIDGLSGEADMDHDNNISMIELNSYVSMKVSMAAKKINNHQQTPVFSPSKFYSTTISHVDSAFHTLWATNAKNGDIFKNMQGTYAYNDSRGVDTVHNDSTSIRFYNCFVAELKKNKLTGPYSAKWYYDELKKHAPLSGLTKDAKFTLIGEFINYATGKINIYLAGKDQTSESKYESSINADLDNKTLNTVDKYKIVALIPYKITADYLAEAKELLKNDTAFANKLEPQYLFFQAKSFFEANHTITLDEAIKKLKEAIKLQPSAAYLHQYLCYLYIERKDYKNAEKEINLSLTLAPTWSYNYCFKGNLHFYKHEFTEAEKAYQRAIELDSTYSESYSNLGNLYLEMNNYEKAEYNYKKAIQFDTSSNNSNGNSKRLYNLAVFYEKQNKINMAETYYRKAIFSDSTYSKAANNLAVILYNSNKAKEAQIFLTSALRKDSMFHCAYNNLGLVYDTLQNFKASEECFIKAIKIAPTDGAAYINLSDIYYRNDNKGKSIEYLELAIKKNATHSESCMYNLACTYAEQKDLKKSLYYFESALKKGFSKKDLILEDTKTGELAELTQLPEFDALMKKYFPDEKK
ncbi:MAG: tetratricopeptide repeat protein [Bacteroidota bacterium]